METGADFLEVLPLGCTLNIFYRLTCGERLLATAVSRPWKAALLSGPLWQRVDLSDKSAEARVNDGLLRCVV